ncbi:MAG TPA: hypothetical protein VF738_03925 [Rhodanobacter sp.]
MIVPLTELAVATAVELALAAPFSVCDDVEEPQPAKASAANDITDKTILRMGVSLVTELDRTRKPDSVGRLGFIAGETLSIAQKAGPRESQAGLPTILRERIRNG